MTDRVDVSVLIPVFNEAAILREAATAMLAQDLDGEAEFLFVDGGSSDDSVAILGELAARAFPPALCLPCRAC
ncbi:MAG: glycosyltransferase, partial [Solirubrobacteraceae bacterium]